MSFGFSISDIITLTQLISRTYNGWKNACGEYASVTRDLAVLQTILQRVEAEAKTPNSLFARNPQDVKGWRTLCKNCRSLVSELEDILKKFGSLGTSRRKNWHKIRMGNRDLDRLSTKLAKHTASISAFVSVLGISSQGRVENELLPEILQRMGQIAAQVRKGNASTISALTTYEDDDKAVWRDFRRDMIKGGISSRDIEKYSAALRTYLARLKREGLLEEEEPPSATTESRSADTRAPASRSDESPIPAGETNRMLAQEEQIPLPVEHIDNAENHNLRHSKKKMKEAPRKSRSDLLDTMSTKWHLAEKYIDQERWNKALKLLLELIETEKKVLGLEHEDTLFTMHVLAFTYRNQHRLEEAERLYMQVLETRRKVLGPEHESTLTTAHNLALTYLDQKRLKEAEELFVHVLETRRKVLGPKHGSTLTTVHNLAKIYLEQKRLKEAEELFVRVLETERKVLGPEHEDTLTTAHYLALIYRKQKRLKEAEELFVHVLETERKVLGPEHEDTLTTAHNLALTYLDQKRLKEAEELFVHVLETRRRVLGPEHEYTLTTAHNLAVTYWEQNRLKEAEELSVHMLETQRKVLGPEHEDTLWSMYKLARTLKSLGRDVEAVSMMKNCLQLATRSLGPQDNLTIWAQEDLKSWEH
jgi:tetratricopeptide (TPR) repeat protein